MHPCPSTGRTGGACPGYRKDHVKPLACGGPDAVWILQWQTIRDAKAKDKDASQRFGRRFGRTTRVQRGGAPFRRLIE
jgi:hypothetical protein